MLIIMCSFAPGLPICTVFLQKASAHFVSWAMLRAAGLESVWDGASLLMDGLSQASAFCIGIPQNVKARSHNSLGFDF